MTRIFRLSRFLSRPQFPQLNLSPQLQVQTIIFEKICKCKLLKFFFLKHVLGPTLAPVSTPPVFAPVPPSGSNLSAPPTQSSTLGPPPIATLPVQPSSSSGNLISH